MIENAYIAMARAMVDGATPESVAQTLSTCGETASIEEAERVLEFARDPTCHRIKIEHLENAHVEHMLRNWSEVTDHLDARRWHLLEFDHDALVTGDEPVAYVGDHRRPGEPLGVGNAREVVAPLDPRHALVMVRPDLIQRERRVRGTKSMAEVVNRHIAFGCDRFIVRRPGTDPLRGIELPPKAHSVTVKDGCIVLQPRVSQTAAKHVRVPPPPRLTRSPATPHASAKR
jgi:hypothetical protein